MKEELCYVAFNPATEEKVMQPDTVYKLPDGQTIRVCCGAHAMCSKDLDGRKYCTRLDTSLTYKILFGYCPEVHDQYWLIRFTEEMAHIVELDVDAHLVPCCPYRIVVYKHDRVHRLCVAVFHDPYTT